VEQIARVVDHRVKELFPDGAVIRAELLRDVDVPGRLTVRVFIPAAEDVTEWAAAHQDPMKELRTELSRRLPSAKLRVAYVKALKHVTGLSDVPAPIAHEARDALAALAD
jgi:hypothetical protein